MNLSYAFRMIVRSWLRSPLSTFISLVSLVVGLVCSTVLILYVMGEYRTSRALGQDPDLYLVLTHEMINGTRQPPILTVNGDRIAAIAERYSEVKQWGAFIPRSQALIKGNRDWKQSERPWFYSITPSVLDLFDLPVEQGNLASTLAHPGEIAITRELATLLFGAEDPIGKIMTIDDYRYLPDEGKGTRRDFDYTVTTILGNTDRLPLGYCGFWASTSLEAGATQYSDSPMTSYGFVRLHPGTDIADLSRRISADTVLDLMGDSLSLMRFDRAYLGEELVSSNVWADDFPLIKSSDPQTLYIALSIALAVLVIACFNYINITMTRSARRLKNMAGQRIMGASRWTVRWHTVLDTGAQVVIAFAVALLIISEILPEFNSFMGSHLAFGDLLAGAEPWVLLGLLAMITAASSLFVILKLEQHSVLLSFKAPGAAGMGFARVMVIAQFVVSIVLVSLALNITRQINYIVHTIPDAQRLLEISEYSDPLPQEYIDRVSSLASVEVALKDGLTPGMTLQVSTDRDNPAAGSTLLRFNFLSGPEYFDFYGIPVVEGRLPEPEELAGPMKAIVNRAYVDKIEAGENPVDKPTNRIPTFLNGNNPISIIGVVENTLMGSARKETEPTVLVFGKNPWISYENTNRIYIKTTGPALERLEELRALWRELSPGQPEPEFKTIAQRYREQNSAEDRLRRIVGFFAGVSMLLTAMGLFGLAWYSVERRRKEIALRKIHGSTPTQVVRLLCRSFVAWMATAVVIALPVAWWLSQEWLRDFVYKAPLAWWLFVLTAVVAAVVTLLTVTVQSWRAATENPVESLKSE